MDFDYYIIAILMVKCIKNDIIETHFIEFERYKMYYLFIFNGDEDNTNYNCLAKKEIEYISEIYSRMDHVIYENKQWTSHIMITEYTNHLTLNGIDLNDVINIEKKHHYQKKEDNE
ncbi:hypothetical protein Klosneuvirus_3_277 [Klosneuvirus KNV1]|uniref:Uncharacterized protein n=1 Tax=Klosneuvirus KNV1 TaxID=1977640 RepID=A0A1V0SKA1_9VIRU|nr:hypothetical protein Klosneuvirus_3_277 [Klosneuvirus KNV1]